MRFHILLIIFLISFNSCDQTPPRNKEIPIIREMAFYEALLPQVIEILKEKSGVEIHTKGIDKDISFSVRIGDVSGKGIDVILDLICEDFNRSWGGSEKMRWNFVESKVYEIVIR